MQLQLFYLVCYLDGTVQRGGEVWDSHFAVGVACITIVDFCGSILTASKSTTSPLLCT
jgi:hypothetical protein